MPGVSESSLRDVEREGRPHQPDATGAKPVARLETSGPDGPRSYSDSGLGPTWFAAKPTAPGDDHGHDRGDNKAATPNPTEAGHGTRKINIGGGPEPVDESAGVVLDVDLTGLLNGMTAEQAIIEASGDAPHSPAAGTAAPARRAPEALLPQAAAIAASGREAGRGPDAQSWRDRDNPAPPPLPPAPGPAEPQSQERPVKPLSAADLDAIRWRLDGGTLREVVDDQDALRELGDRLDEPLSDETDNVARAELLCVRAEVYRLLGELGMAAAASRLALAHAESAGDTQAIVIAQAELAHVLRLRGDSAEADRLFEAAASSEAHPNVRCVVHENAGRSCFDQGRHMEALDHFARAIRLGSPDDMDLVERIDVSLEAVYIHVLRDGWGPYPRLRREILGYVRPGTTR